LDSRPYSRFALRPAHAREDARLSVIVIAILAIGIGANAAIFSIVYAVLLKPLPFQHPGQLVFLSEAKPQNGISSAGASYDNFTDIRVQNNVFSELAGIATHELTFTRHGEPALVDIAGITPELFSLLGTKPLLGRLFIADDGKQGAVALDDDTRFFVKLARFENQHKLPGQRFPPRPLRFSITTFPSESMRRSVSGAWT
jgi:MacB-like periplasmic core domain